MHLTQTGGTLATIFVQIMKPGAQRHDFVHLIWPGGTLAAIFGKLMKKGAQREYFSLCTIMLLRVWPLKQTWFFLRFGGENSERWPQKCRGSFVLPAGKTNGVRKGNRELVCAKQC